MSRLFYHVMQDNAGNLLFNVSGTMRLAGTGTLATIYGDEGLTIPIANPMTNHPSFGSFKCFLGVGDYDFSMAKAGYTFETLTGVQGLGTMADQNATAVAIAGGTATLSALTATIANVTKLILGGQGDIVGFGGAQVLRFDKSASWGLIFQQLVNDTGSGNPIGFLSFSGATVGAIITTATTTTYTTTSDARLKHDVDDLTGELAIIQALRPVAFKWVADDSPGVGFLAHEVAAHVQGVIVGEEGAVDEAGGIVPQMIDYSKLVPFLVGAVKTLTARIAVLEDALGV